MRTIGNLTACMIVACAAAGAQDATYTITPDSAPPGVQRVIQVTAPPNAGIDYIAIGCQLTGVFSGGPGGTFIPIFGPVCAVIPIPTPPCGTHSASWMPPAVLAPGTYWMPFFYLESGTFNQVTKWVDFRIEGPPAPTLVAGPPLVGQPWSLSLSAPGAAGAGYITAASLSTDSGLPISPTLFASLDTDLLFGLSFPSPDPTLFSAFQGTLDAVGGATPTVLVPNVPGIGCIGLHVQSFVFTPGGLPALSNCFDAVIQ